MSTIVITGGSRGIGAAAVELFAAKGHRVCFLYGNNHAAAQVVAEKTGATPICCDVADGQAVKEAFAAIGSHDFTDPAYASLYAALAEVQSSHALVVEPNYTGYYGKVYTFYGLLREKQGEWKARTQSGEDAAQFMEESWRIFESIG